MTRKRLLLAMGAVLAVSLAGYLVLRLAPPRDPLIAAYNRIQVGMTDEEAEAIVGRPRDGAGSEASDPDWRWREYQMWDGGSFQIKTFSENGHVVEKEFTELDDSFLGRLLHRLGMSH